jgi:peptidoglycan/LPS O-acetylase OafA/YrhL
LQLSCAVLLRKRHIDPEHFLRRENNNFDLIRLVGACTVIFSHTYAIAWANFSAEPFARITDAKLAVGVPFLYMFFFLSGFLVTRSFENSRSASHFLQKRLLRIFPALVVMVLVVMFVVGPLFNELSVGEYFRQRHTWGFLRNISLLRLQPTLPGVFPDNPDPYFAQTNLWSVTLEFCWYMLTALFGLLALFRNRWRQPALIGLWLLLYGAMAFFGDWMLSKDIPLLDLELKPFVRVGIYYVAGSIFYLYRHFFLRLNPWLLLLITPLWFWSVVNGLSDWTTPLFIPFFTILFATLPLRASKRITGLGDPTYGMYIYGVPAQQAVVALLGTNWMVAFVAAWSFLMCWAWLPGIWWRSGLWGGNGSGG